MTDTPDLAATIKRLAETGNWSDDPLVCNELVDAWLSAVRDLGAVGTRLVATLQFTVDHLSAGKLEVVRAGDLIPRAEVGEKLAERRAKWCLAWPGSDEEMASLLAGFDSAVEIALASPGPAQGEGE